MQSFYETLTAAVADFTANGYDSAARLEAWTARIREAAWRDLTPEHELAEALRKVYEGVYARVISPAGMARVHPGAARFTVANVAPRLRGELARRTASSAQLIKLNRQKAIELTTQRFAGWASSVPPGGSGAVEKVPVKTHIRKALAQLPFEERRVLIDQSAKFTAELNNIIAVDGGAIAMRWHSHWRQPHYNYRIDHKERDGQVYTLRSSWAINAGLMKAGPAGYYDDITKVGQEIFCRCNAVWLYALRELPADQLTIKGASELERVRRAIAQGSGAAFHA